MNPFQRFNTILFITLAVAVFAQDPPANNTYQTATELTVQAERCNTLTIGDLTHATNSNNADYSSVCISTADDAYDEVPYADVWYKVTVPNSGDLVIETSPVENSPLRSIIMVAYTLDNGQLTEIACKTDTQNSFSRLELLSQVKNTELYIMVVDDTQTAWNRTNELGPFNICAFEPILPTNDTYQTATELTVQTEACSTQTFGDLFLATNSNGMDYSSACLNPSMGFEENAYADLWYKATVPNSGNLAFQMSLLEGSLLTNAVMVVYTLEEGVLTEIDCNNSGVSEFFKVVLSDQAPGTEVYVMVVEWNDQRGYRSDFRDDFNICAFEPIIPANDTYQTATELTVQPESCSTQTFGDLYLATNSNNMDYSSPCINVEEHYQPVAYADVWYKVTVPNSGNLVIETSMAEGSSLLYTVMVVYTLEGDVLTEIDFSCGGSQLGFSRVALAEQVPSTELYIMVVEWYDQAGIHSDNRDSFNICAYDPLITNNTYQTATELTVQAQKCRVLTQGNLADATNTNNMDYSSPCINTIGGHQPVAYADVWYKSTVPSSGNLVIETSMIFGSSLRKSILVAYTLDNDELTEIDCNDNEYGFVVIELSGQTPGTEIYFMVVEREDQGGYSSGYYRQPFYICAYDPDAVPDTPPNDTYQTATILPVQSTLCSEQTQGDLAGATNSNNADYSSVCIHADTVEKENAYADVWYKATVPASGNLVIETSAVEGSIFYDSVIVAYNLLNGELVEIVCRDDNGDKLFTRIELTDQVEGTEVYAMVVDHVQQEGNSPKDDFLGPFNICAYDPSPLEVSPSAKPILSYYSNPVGNRLAVESPYYILSLSVYDLSGREVLSQIPNKKQLTVNTYSLAPAVYLMRVQTTNGIKTVKLVKR